MTEPLLLVYSFAPPRPGTEIIERLRSAEAAVFGGVGEESGNPPLRASCGESHGIAYWGPEEGWVVADARAVATLDGVRAERPVSGEAVSLTGDERLAGLDFPGGRVQATDPAALEAFAGAGIGAG